MLHPSYGLPSSFSSVPGALGYRKRFLGWDWDKKLHNNRELPTWSTESPKELIATRKRPWQESQPDDRSKRVAQDRLTFVPGTFRPVLILDDDGCLDPVVARKIDRSGSSRECPVVVEDDCDSSAAPEHSVTPPRPESRQAQYFLGRSDAAPKWIAHKPSCRSRNSFTSQESTVVTSSYLPKLDVQDSPEPLDIDAIDLGLFPVLRRPRYSNKSTHSYAPRKHRATSLPTSLEEAQDLDLQPTPLLNEGESEAFSDSHVIARVRRAVVEETLSLKERKRFFISNPTRALEAAMTKFVDEVYSAFLQYLDEEECWLHPSPPGGFRRAKGCLARNFYWTDDSGRHRLTVNYGIIALLIYSFLTETQKEGWITDSWHLSHLCGNWTCCNWRHLTVEPGRVNISRNACFMHRSGCIHEPKCMKEKKQRLSQISKSSESIAEIHNVSQVTEEKEERVFTTSRYPLSQRC